MIKKTKIALLSCFICCCTVLSSCATLDMNLKIFGKKKDNAPVEVKSKTAYENLFSDKVVKTARGGGLIFHKIEDKLYLELSQDLFNKGFVISTVIEQTCSAGDGLAFQHPTPPYMIRFSRSACDTIVHIKEFAPVVIADGGRGVEEAVRQSNTDPIVAFCKIKAYTPTTNAMIVDVTDFFLSDKKSLRPLDLNGSNSFEGWATNRADFKPKLSLLSDIVSGKESVSIVAEMSFGMSVDLLGVLSLWSDKPQSVLTRYSIHPMSEPMQELRLCDQRIGVRAKVFERFSDKEQQSQREYYACRRNIFDSMGNVKPVIYYIDTTFNPNYRSAIEKGVLMWNDAFEKLGYNNVLQVRSLPSDSEFAGNTAYNNCIRYVATSDTDPFTQSWIDPRSGEIIGSEILVPFNVTSGIQKAMFLAQAAVDSETRTTKLSDKQIADALTAIIARRVSSSLGILPNYAASSAYPTDSLRSPSFTQVNGLSASITDDVYYNIVAQPGDKERGVKLISDALGPYDYLAIEWLYKPIPEADIPQQETKYLSAMLNEKYGDPRYFYTPYSTSTYDPRVGFGDLGDDQLKSVAYQFENMKYMAVNGGDWLASTDKNYKYRETIFFTTVQKLNSMIERVLDYIGGIYVNNKYEGSQIASYESVPYETQHQAVLALMEMVNDMEWIEQQAAPRNIFEMVDPGNYLQRRTLSLLVNKLVELDLSVSKSTEENPYRIEDMSKDLIDYVTIQLRSGKQMSVRTKTFQQAILNIVITKSNIKIKEDSGDGQSSSGIAFSETDISDMLFSKSAYDTFVLAESDKPSEEATSYGYKAPRFVVPEFKEYIFYDILEQLRAMYSKELYRSRVVDTKDFCRYMIDQIDRAKAVK